MEIHSRKSNILRLFVVVNVKTHIGTQKEIDTPLDTTRIMITLVPNEKREEFYMGAIASFQSVVN